MGPGRGSFRLAQHVAVLDSLGNMNANGVVVSASEVTRRYGEGEAAVDALRGVSLDVKPGELVAVMGPSGSGKSTLMHLLAALDKPTGGTIKIAGQDVGDALRSRGDDAAPPQHRLRLPVLQPAADADGGGERRPAAVDRGREARPGVLRGPARARRTDRSAHPPSLRALGRPAAAGGDRAGARPKPTVVFADEPTGNLDSKTGGEILELLRASAEELGQTMVMVTHDAHAAEIADRILFLADGASSRSCRAAARPRSSRRWVAPAHDPRRARGPARSEAPDGTDRARNRARRRDGERDARAHGFDRPGLQLDLHRCASGLRRGDQREVGHRANEQGDSGTFVADRRARLLAKTRRCPVSRRQRAPSAVKQAADRPERQGDVFGALPTSGSASRPGIRASAC